MCVRVQGVVSSVKPGRQERGRRKRNVISALSKLSWWMNSKNVRIMIAIDDYDDDTVTFLLGNV